MCNPVGEVRTFSVGGLFRCVIVRSGLSWMDLFGIAIMINISRYLSGRESEDFGVECEDGWLERLLDMPSSLKVRILL